MSSIVVGGLAIPVSAPNPPTRDRMDMVDRSRAFDGTYRASLTGNVKRQWRFSTPPLPSSRAALYEGKLATVPAQVCSGSLLGGASNLLIWSEEYDNAIWTKDGTTVGTNAVSAPDGTTTADRTLETGGGAAQHRIYQQSVTTVAGPVSWSVFALAGERGWIGLRSNGGTVVANFNLSTGVLGTTNTTATITAMGNGWYRCTMIGTASGVNEFLTINLGDADTGTGASYSYIGDVTKSVYLWGGQIENTATPTSYVKTTTATVDTKSLNCFTEVTGYRPIKQSGSQHLVVLDFNLHEA